ncbi:TonB-dependent receptor [Zhongshania sp.]|jgi:iron complex outermembrane receptor protein|uniref:TonB-dependent receptor n=1 Tax=Zhongshania sp. TaxID=1971902 RepID=UPI0039E41429
MKIFRHSIPKIAFSTAYLSIAALPVAAQDTDSANAGKETRYALEEVMVTAQKRSENLQDVPLSVSVMSGDEVREKGLKNLNEVSLYAPNTRITAGGNGGSVKMRGLGSGNNSGFEQAVAFVIDGVYYGRINYMRSGLVDLGGIEILRGPQGTLMGKNAIAGAVNMSTQNPHQEWELDLAYGVGDRNRKVTTAIVNAPLIDDALSLRLVAKTERQEGYYENATLDRDSQGLDSELYRVKIGFDAIENLSVVANYEESSYSIFGASLEMLKATEGTLRINREYEPDFEAEADYRNWGNSDSPSINEIRIGTIKVDYDWGDYILTSISGWSDLFNTSTIDADAGPIPFISSASDDDYEQYSQEFRITSPADGAFDYVAGLFLFGTEFENDSDLGLNSSLAPIVLASQRNPNLVLPGFSNSPTFSRTIDDHSIGVFVQETTSAALFGQMRWRIFDSRMTLMAGLRYSYEEKEASMARRFEGNSTFFTSVQGHEEFETDAKRIERDFSPKLSVSYALSDDVNVYTTYAKAFKGGGYNAAANTADEFEFDEEQADTYELGIKGQLLDGMLRLNFATFYTEFTGLQVSSFNGDSFIVKNAANATTQGIELDTTLLAAAGLIVKFSAGYTDARYDSFTNASCPVGQNPPCDLSGERLDKAPEWTGTLGFNYNLPLGDLPIEFMLGADATYQSSQFTAGDNDPESIEPKYVKYNARLGIQASNGSWQLLLDGKNLSDEKTLISTADVPVQPGSYMGVYNEPKAVSLDFRIRY